MSYQTIQKNLSKFKYLYQLSGMKLHSIRGVETTRLKYRGFFIFNYIWMNLDCLGSLIWLCMGIVNNETFTELSFVAPCMTFGVLGSAKALCYTLNDREAYKLIEGLIKLEKTKETSYLEIEEKIKITETNFLRTVLNILNGMYILLIILYITGPLIAIIVTYYRTGELRLYLPFLDIYPFDALSLKYWPYAYIHQAWSVCLVLFYAGSADCFLLTCITYIRIQFLLVKVDIVNIIPAKTIASGLFREDTEFRSKFQELVCRHQEIISLSKSLEKIYSKSILINVLTSSMVICLTGFNVTVIEELTMKLPSSVFLATSLLQVLCLCYSGDMLMSSSDEVCGAVYTSKWYLADKKIVNKLLIILVRTQKACILTASGYMEVNLRAFMKILSTSWSYFALLKTIYTR